MRSRRMRLARSTYRRWQAPQLAAVLALGRLAVHGGIQAPGGVLLAHPGHGGVVDLQRGGDRPVGP